MVKLDAGTINYKNDSLGLDFQALRKRVQERQSGPSNARQLLSLIELGIKEQPMYVQGSLLELRMMISNLVLETCRYDAEMVVEIFEQKIADKESRLDAGFEFAQKKLTEIKKSAGVALAVDDLQEKLNQLLETALNIDLDKAISMLEEKIAKNENCSNEITELYRAKSCAEADCDIESLVQSGRDLNAKLAVTVFEKALSGLREDIEKRGKHVMQSFNRLEQHFEQAKEVILLANTELQNSLNARLQLLFEECYPLRVEIEMASIEAFLEGKIFVGLSPRAYASRAIQLRKDPIESVRQSINLASQNGADVTRFISRIDEITDMFYRYFIKELLEMRSSQSALEPYLDKAKAAGVVTNDLLAAHGRAQVEKRAERKRFRDALRWSRLNDGYE